MPPQSPFALLGKQRFLPFFLTQALGAFNDNLYKQSLILAILFKLSLDENLDFLVNLCALLFILPFFLFSALGGQFGEKYAKDALIRLLKLAEIAIMAVAATGLLLGNLPLLLLALFAMGSQSALFGPVKYSILPQHLKEQELMGGNALVEMGTFLAILAGTLGAGLMMSSDAYAPRVATAILLMAGAGYLLSRAIPRAAAALPSLRLDWHIFRQSAAILRLGFSQQRAVSHAMIGISWFWFVGAVYLTQIPAYAQRWLNGDETVVSLILLVFSIGIGLGSLLCARLSRGQIEPGLVPFGALGLTFFGLLLGWHSGGFSPGPHDWLSVLGQGQAWWVLADILGLGLFGGLYIVPLYALIQSRTPAQERARVIAANNILNALFMVISALVSMVALSLSGLSIPQLFALVALLNIALNAFILLRVPEFGSRFCGWLRGH